MSKKQDDTVKVSKVAIWQGLTAVFAILFVIALFTGGFGIGSTTGNAGVNPPGANNNNGGAAGNLPAEVELEGAYTLGSADAPVTIVEWSDFQCPFCARFYSETYAQIKEDYVETGKVKFVFKQFPLDSIHPMATPAALASECAGEQDMFFEMHDKIFENAASLSESNFKKWAGELGLDQEQFDSCYDSQKYLSKVRADLAEGQAAGIRGTPGFLVNGQLVSGAQPYSVFKAAIEANLN